MTAVRVVVDIQAWLTGAWVFGRLDGFIVVQRLLSLLL